MNFLLHKKATWGCALANKKMSQKRLRPAPKWPSPLWVRDLGSSKRTCPLCCVKGKCCAQPMTQKRFAKDALKTHLEIVKNATYSGGEACRFNALLYSIINTFRNWQCHGGLWNSSKLPWHLTFLVPPGNRGVLRGERIHILQRMMQDIYEKLLQYILYRLIVIKISIKCDKKVN